jgi:hypothetical protein
MRQETPYSNNRFDGLPELMVSDSELMVSGSELMVFVSCMKAPCQLLYEIMVSSSHYCREGLFLGQNNS